MRDFTATLAAYITSISVVWCDIFPKHIKFTNHYKLAKLQFSCLGFRENNRVGVKGPTGCCSFSIVPDILYSQPLATNAPQILTAGRSF